MIEIRSILAPTDFSAHSEQAVRYACGLAERLGAELHLLHVLSEIFPAGPDPLLMPVMPPGILRGERGAGPARPSPTARPAWGKPRSLVMAVRWGSPVEAIVAYAEDLRVDLIVIATHGRTGLCTSCWAPSPSGSSASRPARC